MTVCWFDLEAVWLVSVQCFRLVPETAAENDSDIINGNGPCSLRLNYL